MTKVFFTVPFSGKKDYQEVYDLILKSIKKNKVQIYSTELGNYKEILSSKEKKGKTEEEIHYLAIKKGIRWADVVVLEVSKECYQVGHELSLALQNKTPVLSLSLTQDWSKRIIDPFHFGAKYTKYFLDEIIREFIEKNAVDKLSERFNLFLSKKQLERLEEKAKEKGVNKSEYLRRLI